MIDSRDLDRDLARLVLEFERARDRAQFCADAATHLAARALDLNEEALQAYGAAAAWLRTAEEAARAIGQRLDASNAAHVRLADQILAIIDARTESLARERGAA